MIQRIMKKQWHKLHRDEFNGDEFHLKNGYRYDNGGCNFVEIDSFFIIMILLIVCMNYMLMWACFIFQHSTRNMVKMFGTYIT